MGSGCGGPARPDTPLGQPSGAAGGADSCASGAVAPEGRVRVDSCESGVAPVEGSLGEEQRDVELGRAVGSVPLGAADGGACRSVDESDDEKRIEPAGAVNPPEDPEPLEPDGGGGDIEGVDPDRGVVRPDGWLAPGDAPVDVDGAATFGDGAVASDDPECPARAGVEVGGAEDGAAAGVGVDGGSPVWMWYTSPIGAIVPDGAVPLPSPLVVKTKSPVEASVPAAFHTSIEK
jgi:hypothetical protein